MAKTKLAGINTAGTLAKDIMSTVLIVIRSDQTVREAVELLTENKLTVLPVLDKLGKLVGVVSEKDILRACETFDMLPGNFLDSKIQFQHDIKTASLTTPIDEIGTLLAHGGRRHVPIVDNHGLLKGIITRRDLIRVIYLRLELSREGKSGQI